MQLYLMRWPRWTTGGFSLRRNALPAATEAATEAMFGKMGKGLRLMDPGSEACQGDKDGEW